MIILGVDPGTLITGYGVIEVTKGRCRVLEYDVVKNRSNRSMPLRLKAIYSTLCDVINRHHPDEFAIETAFYGKNAQSALKIGHARGVSILAAVNHEIPSTEYSPREVKKAVVGNGAASKEQVQAMIKSMLQLRQAPKFFDATDALAVALCHSHRYGRPGGSSRSRSRSRFRSDLWSEYVRKHPERVLVSR
ncbi:MAG: crossover junction endodeoxyribonuclease RuvC [Ignavibacteriales bacterium]|nr:crossover junction endodeoxyribonuclease RuvC [Ignavibacteriales bacterium]